MAELQGENFAWQNSRQESENPRMDFRFHVFGNTDRKKSEFYKKNRCKDVAAQESENFAEQNSRQESRNPWMDFWFHVFGNANVKKSEKSKKKFLIFWRFRTFVILQVVFVITAF